MQYGNFNDRLNQSNMIGINSLIMRGVEVAIISNEQSVFRRAVAAFECVASDVDGDTSPLVERVFGVLW